MKHFRWLIVNLLSMISLLLCIAALVMWVRSYYRIDSVIHFRPKHEQTTMWIDHRTMVTIRSGPVYEADSRRGELRLLYLYNDGSFDRCELPWWISDRVKDEAGLGEMPLPTWIAQTHGGFALEHRAVGQMPYNMAPAPIPSLPTAYTIHALYTPWWFCAVMFAVLPARLVVRMVRAQRRRRRGQCEGCGYDMRATPDRCPECGNMRAS